MGGSSRRPIHFISEFYGSSDECEHCVRGGHNRRDPASNAIRPSHGDRKRHTKNDKCFWSVRSVPFARHHIAPNQSNLAEARSLLPYRPVSLSIVRLGRRWYACVYRTISIPKMLARANSKTTSKLLSRKIQNIYFGRQRQPPQKLLHCCRALRGRACGDRVLDRFGTLQAHVTQMP